MSPTNHIQCSNRPTTLGVKANDVRAYAAALKRFVRVFFGLVVAGTLLSGCSTTPFEGYQQDGRYCFRIDKRKVCTTDPVPSPQQESTAKLFAVDPERQIVWIVRNARFDAYGKVSVSVNGNQVEMLPYTVSRFALTPGRHHLVAAHRSRAVGEATIDGKAGGQTFVEVHADIGIFATHFSLRKIQEEEGRRKAMVSKLISDQR